MPLGYLVPTVRLGWKALCRKVYGYQALYRHSLYEGEDVSRLVQIHGLLPIINAQIVFHMT